jgi:DNA repair protein RadD
MNINLEKIYLAIKPNINSHLAKPILGDTIGIGIEKYFKLKQDLLDTEIDYAEIIVEALDKNIFSNKEFIDSFILFLIKDKDITSISLLLNISNELSIVKQKREIIKISSTKLKKTIITHFNLDEEYFRFQSIARSETSETISPFNPVPVDDENFKKLIKKEYLSLHNYQKNIKDRVIQKLLFDKPNSKMLVHMPTGSGKTKTAIEAIIDFIRVSLRLAEDGGTIIWFAHSKELCEQAYQSFKTLWQFKGDYPIKIYNYFGDSDVNELINCKADKASIIFCGFQKFNSIYSSTFDKQPQFDLKHFFHTNTKLVIVDEAHKSLAATYQKAIEFVNSMPNCRLIGLTATPGRSNYIEGDSQNNNLSDFFDNNIISISDENGSRLKDPLSYLQNAEILAKIEFEELDFNLDLVALGYNSKNISTIVNKIDLGQEELDLISTDPERNAIILNKIKECVQLDESTLVFACTKDHCIILQRLLKYYGIESSVILGETNNDYRSNEIKRFKKNELKVLINYGVLSTGFDAPNLNALIMARPTKSIVLYSQIVGRALRGPGNGGNKTNKIITIKDNMVGFPNPSFMFSYWEGFWK